MNTTHLTDEELQQFAMNSSSFDSSIAEHVHFCEHCKEAVETYRLLFDGIHEQEVPAFEFDLSALVVKQLQPSPKLVALPEDFLIWLLAFVTVLFASGLSYFFWPSIKALFSNTGSIVLSLAISSVVVLLIFLCIDQYKTYQQKMKALDFY